MTDFKKIRDRQNAQTKIDNEIALANKPALQVAPGRNREADLATTEELKDCKITSWESNFIASINGQLKGFPNGSLSVKQAAILDKLEKEYIIEIKPEARPEAKPIDKPIDKGVNDDGIPF